MVELVGRARRSLQQGPAYDIIFVPGSHIQVCCHTNNHVAAFALDSLRQLSMRFLEKEELVAFKFQQEFLKPFEHTMANSNNVDIQDMVRF